MLHLALLALIGPLQAEPTSIAASQTTNEARFGSVVALDGGTLLVGAPKDFTQGLFAGSVHVYGETPQGGWTRQALFRGVPFAQAGGSLAIKNGVAVVAGGGESNRPGFVLESVQGQWVKTADLAHPVSGLAAGYGRSIDTNGDLIVVGAATPNSAQLKEGDVFVYRRVSGAWALVQTLRLPVDPMTGQRPEALFGHRVSLDGDRLAVSAPSAEFNGVADAGLVRTYTYAAGQFTHDGTIPPPSLPGGTRFGFHGLSLSDGRLAVGVSNASVGGLDRAGVVNVYRDLGAGQWIQEASLPDPRPTPVGQFGLKLDMEGDRLVVGRFPFARQEYGPGMLDPEVFERTSGPTGPTWVLQDRILDPLPANDNWYGSGLALSDDRVAVGASRTMVDGFQPGGAHVGSLATGWAPTAELVCTGGPCSCPSPTGWEGCGNTYARPGFLYTGFGRLSANGSSSVSADDLQLNASSLGKSTFARLALGPGLARPALFGDGTLCIQAVRRLAPVATNSIGRVTLPTGVVALAASQLGAAGTILAGETWVFQVIYDEPDRVFPCPGQYGYDPGSGLWDGRPFLTARGFNLTNGLSITFTP